MRFRYYALTLLTCILAACGSGPAVLPGPILTEEPAATIQAAATEEPARAPEENISRVSSWVRLDVSTCPNTQTSDSVTFADEVLHLVNSERARANLNALTINSSLTSAAQAHAMDTACKLFLSHTGSDGSSPFDRMLHFGYSYSRAAENVAAGYPTPLDVVHGWMGSSGHRANIMNPSFTEAGIGYVYNSSSTTGNYYSYWAMTFGTP